MRIFALCAAVALTSFAALCAPASAVDIPAGSYSASCVSIQTQGDYLYASCQDITGQYHPTSIYVHQCLRGLIANNNGRLVCGSGGQGIGNQLPRGSWRASCRNASKSDAVLSAQCDTGSGSWRTSSLDLNTCFDRLVGNDLGSLVCERVVVGSSLPPGSWRTTCRNARMSGTILYAQCDTGYGKWNDSALDTRHCQNGRIGNGGGNLYCETRSYNRRRV